MGLSLKIVPKHLEDMINAANLKVLTEGAIQLHKGKMVNIASNSGEIIQNVPKYIAKTKCENIRQSIYTITDEFKIGNKTQTLTYTYAPKDHKLSIEQSKLETPRGTIFSQYSDQMSKSGTVSLADSEGKYEIAMNKSNPCTGCGYDPSIQTHFIVPKSTHTETVNYILGKENAKNAYAQLIENLKKHLPIFDK